MNTKVLKEYIEKVRWQRAKDGSHEYTVSTWKPELDNEFRKLVSVIYEYGSKDKFKGTTYTYLKIDEYTYWTMNYPIEVTILINRKIDVSKE